MSNEATTTTPGEKALDAQTLQDVLSTLSQIGAREALSLKATVSGKNYVLQLMTMGPDACVVTAFEEGARDLSFQFSVNMESGQYLYGALDEAKTSLLKDLLAAAKTTDTVGDVDTSGPTDAKVTGILGLTSRAFEALAKFIDGDDRVNRKGLPHKENPYA